MHEKLAKYFSGELSQSEKASLLKEIKGDVGLKDEFVRMQNNYALSRMSRLSIDEREGKRGFINFEYKLNKKKRRQVIRIAMQYAAVAIVMIASTLLVSRYIPDNNNNELNSLYVPAGQRAQLTLEDGSSVWLNANSTLRYPSNFSKKERRVEIEGEAYFDIAQNKKKPFIVSTKNVNMKVLGTQFNVHSYPNTEYVTTNLIEGSVRVSMNNIENKGVTLTPNQQVTVSGNQMTVSTTSNDDYFLWTEGVYTFHNERLLDIINKLQLYYDVKIIVEEPEIFNVRYTGKFRQRDGIDEILRIIQKIRNFGIKKDIENNIITLTK